jgi:hypothetical protein
MNSDDLLKYFSSLGFFDEIKNQIKSERSEGRNFVISPLYGAAESLFINELVNDEDKILILTSDDKLATELSVELELISLNKKIILFRYSLPLIKDKAYLLAMKGGDLTVEFKKAETKYKAHIKKSTIYELAYKPTNLRNTKGKKLVLLELQK